MKVTTFTSRLKASLLKPRDWRIENEDTIVHRRTGIWIPIGAGFPSGTRCPVRADGDSEIVWIHSEFPQACARKIRRRERDARARRRSRDRERFLDNFGGFEEE